MTEEFDKQLALIRWRSHIHDMQPEIAPVFEVNGNVITLLLMDMNIAYCATKDFPEACGYRLEVFCGNELRFIVPERRRT